MKECNEDLYVKNIELEEKIKLLKEKAAQEFQEIKTINEQQLNLLKLSLL
jgi:hypothetical protein